MKTSCISMRNHKYTFRSAIALLIGLSLICGLRLNASSGVALPTQSTTESSPTPESIAQLILDSATCVVVGEVLSTTSMWSADSSLILSSHVVRVMSAIKGHTPQEIVLETRGGTIGEITLVISDEFQVLRGSQYLIIQDKSQLTSESESTWRIDRLIDPQNEKDQQLVKCLIAQSSTNDGGGK